ncbi:MAG: diaminopimelate decarboxylase, partial [Bacteroidota bacterium]
MQAHNNRYLLSGDVDPLALVQAHGAPLYVYDGEMMRQQYQRMTTAFAKVKRLKINYACKALTNINVLRLFRSLGSGLDTVSIQEVELGLMAGFAPHDIIYTPNCVSFEEVR